MVFGKRVQGYAPWRLVVALVLAMFALGPVAPVAHMQAGTRSFPETGHTLKGRFLEYWNAHGGLAQQGLPISDEFQEKSALDGKAYLVQYFERAVFEYHPENAAPYDVLLSQLGAFRYRAKYRADGTPRPVGGLMYRGNPQHTGAYEASGVRQMSDVKWKFKAGGSVRASPAIADGIVYFGSHDEHLYAVDMETGQERWRFKTVGWVESSPAVVDGAVYFGSQDGALHALDGRTGQEKWKFQT